MHKDIANLWLPYTQMKDLDLPLKAVKTKKDEIYLSNGIKLIDCISSWWTACHGYNNSYILKKVTNQLNSMPHIMFGGIIHDQAIRLSSRIVDLLNKKLERVFFSDSGSVAIEIAMKMSIQYWLNKGFKNKKKFIHFRNGYHGDTAGAMSVCDPEEGMHTIFTSYLNKNFIADIPTNKNLEKKLALLFKKNSDQIAGLIIEPLIQCAGGMKFYHKDILEKINRIAKRYKILIIYDEIATGFGRTGSMFAFQQTKSFPDILCLGKAITGGIMSLAATVSTKMIFDAFLSKNHNKEFMHGPTYMANPLACSAANASLDIFEKTDVLLKVKKIEKLFFQKLHSFEKYEFVVDVRILGAIAVIEIDKLSSKRIKWLKKEFIKNGIWIRPLRNVIYLMPPFIIKKKNLIKAINALEKIFDKWNIFNEK